MTAVLLRTNLPDFRRELQAMTVKMQRRSARVAVSAAARVLRQAVKTQAAAPKAASPRKLRTGTLARAVYTVRSRRKSGQGVETYVVGVRSGRQYRGNEKRGNRDAFYWRWLEGGWIPRGPGQKFKGGERRRRAAREEALKGGASRVQYPFIEPAFNTAQGRALDEFIRRMGREVQALQAGR